MLEMHDSVGHHFASFFSRKEQYKMLALSRGVVHCSFRREFFASTDWMIPPARWLGYQVLRDFTMKNEITSVILTQGEWQQPLLSRFPALCKVKIISNEGTELLPWHFQTLQVTGLDLRDSKMSDMAPLEAFLNLKTLLLPEETEIYNLHALEYLQGLRSLTIGFASEYGALKDLSFLKKLRNLISLSLQGLKCDLAPIIHLTKLEKLDITACRITDLQPLLGSADTLRSLDASETTVASGSIGDDETKACIASFANLQELVLVETQLFQDVGMTPFAHLINLTSLELGEAECDDLSSLAALTELKALRIKAARGTDWSPIANLKKLELLDQLAPVVSLDAYGAWILASLPILHSLSSPVVLSPKYPLPQVRSLVLSSRSKDALMAHDIAIPVSEVCPNVEMLRLNGCFDLTCLGLSKLQKLDDLNMVELETARVPTEDELQSLSKLTLSNNCGAKDFIFLESLVNLREISMCSQFIFDVSALVCMSHLEKLSLCNSTIEDISPLGNLRNLRELLLNPTPIKDVSCLRGLPELTELSLPTSADCVPLLNDYGVSLPSIRKLDHYQHKCKLLDDLEGSIPGIKILVNLRPVPPVATEYFKRVKHYF